MEEENAALTALLKEAMVSPQGRARLGLAAAFEQFAFWADRNTPPPAANDYNAWVDQIASSFVFANPATVRAGMEQAAGGIVSWNNGVDYRKLLEQSGRKDMVLELYKNAKSDLEADLATLEKASRIYADPAALARAEPLMTYTGKISGPIIVVDNDDPVDAAPLKLAYIETLKKAGTVDLLRMCWVNHAGHGGQTDIERVTGFVTLMNRLTTGKWNDTSPAAMNALAEKLAQESSLQLGSSSFLDLELPMPLRTWDKSNWGTYQTAQNAPAPKPGKYRLILYGTAIDPDKQMKDSQQLAKSVASPDSSYWRAKGDQHRKYILPDTGVLVPYRIYVPTTWDGKSKLPLVLFLHGGGANENVYLDANNKQLLTLAEKNGYLLVSPLGFRGDGAYGTCLRLPAVFGEPQEAAKIMASVTPKKDRILELSEKDVINVLEIIMNEYPVDRSRLYLTGHSMGSGGTWYLGAKYNKYWSALAPISGPFVEKDLYPWDRIREMPVFMTEGTGATPSVKGSRLMSSWMKEQGFKLEYMEVDADHGGMVPLVLPDVFDFFNRNATKK